MNAADRVKAAMNQRQRYRCKQAELRAYNFGTYSFRAWINLGRPCVVHQDWKPGTDWKRAV